jgi:hypothetical protein
MKKILLFGIILALSVCVASFAADTTKERVRDYEVKGWSTYVSDDDIDLNSALITDLDTTYAQLASADKIEIVSASALDITQTVTVTGVGKDGKKIIESIALDTTNGTTAVASVNTFMFVDQVKVNRTCAGVLTIRKATGDTFIVSIPAGRLEGGVAQHFPGDKDTYVTMWKPAVTSTDGIIEFQLRRYSSAPYCLTPTVGYEIVDEISMTNARDYSDMFFEEPVKIEKGGWLAVTARGIGTSNVDGSVLIQGYDVQP